jgi:hypothetical protein
MANWTYTSRLLARLTGAGATFRWGGVIAIVALCTGCFASSDPGSAVQGAYLRRAVAAIGQAPLPVKVICDWSLHTDASGYNCVAYAEATQPPGASRAELVWWRDVALLIRAEQPVIGSWSGADNVYLRDVVLARVDSAGRLYPYYYQCADRSVQLNLSGGSLPVTTEQLVAAGCRVGIGATPVASDADAIGGRT